MLTEAVKKLKKGGVIVYPTSTCYGLGCDATNLEAVKRIYEIKDRGDKALLCLFSCLEMWKKYVVMSDEQEKIIKKYKKKPVSFVLRDRNSLNTVGGRIPNHPVALKLVKKLDKPLISTSANKSGMPNCYSIKCVKKQGVKADYYFNAGILKKNKPTTVYDLINKKTLRKGSVKVNA